MRGRSILLILAVTACKPEAESAPAPPAEESETPSAAPKAETPDTETPDTETKAPPALPEPLVVEPMGEPPREGLQSIVVALPPPVDLEHPSVPATYDGGAWSIRGLRDELDARVTEGESGKEVELRAWVQEIYVPPTCPVDEVCPPAKQPHAWVTDTEHEQGKRHAMMVVNYAFAIPEWDAKRWAGVPHVVLEVGKQYTFRGKVKRFSDTGFSHDAGLLEFVSYRPLNAATGLERGEWVAPPGAPWHPLEIARQEEVNAKLMEKMRKEAK